MDAQQSFPVSSFSSKDSRIPFSFGHCHSQYIYYNIYLSISRNCPLTINKKIAQILQTIFLCQVYSYLLMTIAYQNNIEAFAKKTWTFKHSNCNVMALFKNTFCLRKYYSPLSYHDSEYILNGVTIIPNWYMRNSYLTFGLISADPEALYPPKWVEVFLRHYI